MAKGLYRIKLSWSHPIPPLLPRDGRSRIRHAGVQQEDRKTQSAAAAAKSSEQEGEDQGSDLRLPVKYQSLNKSLLKSSETSLEDSLKGSNDKFLRESL